MRKLAFFTPGSKKAGFFGCIVGASLVLGACWDHKPTPTKSSASAVAAVSLQSAAPMPSALSPSAPHAPVLDTGGRPMSFAPLVQIADPCVATVKAVIRSHGASGLALGSAFVYDPEGYLLTNHHVIEGASGILIGFKDGREFQGKVIGADKGTDIAVVKVEAHGLPALPLGDSDALEVGDWVVAIGNPFGLSFSVSAGIVSAKGRTSEDVRGLDETGYFDFLQTDASINPGNSGGPLLNVRGEVVGINAAIRKDANSIGFAIPMNMVKQLIPLLLRDGRIHRSVLGVTVGELTSDEVERLHLKDRKGARVAVVLGGGPAEKSGLAVDDVILAFDGKPVEGPNALRWFASIYGVGQTATIRISRAGREFDIHATLGQLPDDPNDHGPAAP